MRLVDPWASLSQLAERSKLTLTVSGTASLEAGSLGYPAATVAPMYFRDVLVGNGVNPYDSSFLDLIRNLEDGRMSPPSPSQIREAIGSLIANSRPGLIGAPDDTPSCMTESNLEAVASSLDDLLSVSASAHASR